ncbi:DUF3182 family protein [Candidatus Peregrinibacteria bacterium]|nr:DUF3182 family protein [Candidatus Peregrinibacteria bacterium]
MKPRNIIPFYEGVNLPPSHAEHILQRNGRLAASLAEAQGFSHNNPISHLDPYYVLPTPITKEQGVQHGMTSSADFYGAMVDHLQHADKGQLHQVVPEADNIPAHYSAEFARAVREVVLPGYTAYSKEDAIKAYLKLKKELPDKNKIRLKDPSASDCDRQFVIESEDHLRAILDRIFHPFPFENGIVLEQNLNDVSTTTAGKVKVNGSTYQFIGNQVETSIPTSKGGTKMVYGGGDLLVTNDFLPQNMLTPDQQELTLRIGHTYDAYSTLTPHVSRMSFDMISGIDSQGNEIHGITDPTMRVGGNDPSVIEAMHYLNDSKTIVKAQTRLIYTSTGSRLPFNGTVYLDMDDIKIITRVQ